MVVRDLRNADENFSLHIMTALQSNIKKREEFLLLSVSPDCHGTWTAEILLFLYFIVHTGLPVQDRVHKFLCVRLFWMFQYLLCRSFFYDLSLVHDQDPAAHLLYHRQIMTDKQAG